MYDEQDTAFTDSIQDVCPIPRNVVGLLGGNHGSRPRYLLWKNGQEITVEVPYHNYDSEYDPDNSEYSEWKLFVKSKRTFAHYLEIIQSHLDEINFGSTNWAYLLHDNTGGFYIRQRDKVFPTVSCPLWAPIIFEEEIQFTVWGQPWDRRGLWNGREVDVFYAWNEINIVQLDRAMYAYRVLVGMDLSFELYGHLLRKDGTVIGLVTEAGKGRLINLSDRTLIYHTIANLQARGCLYRGCGTNQFMISPDGKVRLLEPFSLIPYSPKKLHKLEKDADLWHWKELADLFDELKTYGPFGNYRFPPDRFTATSKQLQLIIPPVGPERPLGGIFLFTSSNFFHTYRIPYWEGFQLIHSRHHGRFSFNQKASITETCCTDSDTASDLSSISDTGDRPLLMITEGSQSRTRRGPIRSRAVFHPYRITRVTLSPTELSESGTSDA